MRDVGDKCEDLAVVEDRLEHHVLGNMPRPAVRIVMDHHITWLEPIETKLFQRPVDGELDRANLRWAELSLREHLSFGIEDHAGKVERLVEDG